MISLIKWFFNTEIITDKQAVSIVKKLNENEREKLFSALKKDIDINFGKESKEKKEKSLEFEKDTFKIDSTLWEEPDYGIFKGKKVKVHPKWNVVEYLEDYIRDGELIKKWEQIFINYDNFISHVAEQKKCSIEEAEEKYMMTEDEYKQKMRSIDRAWIFHDFYIREIKEHLSGYWYPDREKFDDLGRWANFWLVGGSHAIIGKYWRDCISHNRYFGFSGRLLKN